MKKNVIKYMKLTEGNFGTGVSSYFLFLKWIFLLNIPVFILTFGFVVLPQILFRYHPPVTTPVVNSTSHNHVPFSGAELLTGDKLHICKKGYGCRFMVFSPTFNNISVIS
jgi:hypothetical protein